MAQYILELKNIGKTFSGVNVLRGVNLQLEKGEVHVLLGENGAGKSTLIKIISGYHHPDKGGEIYVEGERKEFAGPKQPKDAGIHTIYQELTLCKDMTVAENIVIDKQDQLKGFLLKRKQFKEIAEKVLKRLGSDISPDEMVRNLSIAEQQIVEIGKAISADAKVIIMDEPTSSISHKDSERLLEIVEQLRDEGVTIIYISHRLQEIARIADRITVLRDGNQIDTVKNEAVTEEELIAMMVGRKLEDAYTKERVELGEVVLKVENMCSDVFTDISFEVHKGEIFGFGGLVGSKRTEVLETIFGVRPMTGGKIWLFGEEYVPTTPKQAIKRGMAFVTEDRKKTGLVLCLPILDNLSMLNAKGSTKGGFLDFKRLKELAQGQREALNIRISTMGLPVQTLSGGNQQKVALGKWLDIKPKIILFDEPTRGIDIGAKAEIYKIMAGLVKEGVSIIMVSSELPELISVADNILVMNSGRMRGIIGREEISQELVMSLATTS
ncbi:MAG: sugar ABC transporter ATP-binding protein [Lachnospiraceae bacterium]|nr:sugar ABC transporter ATP-binding protein [Lachnospiraceae bacterium]